MNKNIVILLTATIDPKGVVFTTIEDPKFRLDESRKAIRKWMDSKSVSKIVFCENSNYDISRIKKEISESKNSGKLELLQFDGQHFNRKLGKGYGEMLTMDYALKNSKWLSEAGLVLKVNGRYFIKNIDDLMARLQSVDDETMIIADFRGNLTSSDSRVFAFMPEFFSKYLLNFQKQLNDSGGLIFEWALARAIHKSMSEGKRWQMMPIVPIIEGRNGSTGKEYSTDILTVLLKKINHSLKKRLMKI